MQKKLIAQTIDIFIDRLIPTAWPIPLYCTSKLETTMISSVKKNQFRQMEKDTRLNLSQILTLL